MKYVPPSVSETAFNCPHCGALSQQTWRSTSARRLGKGNKPTDAPFFSRRDPSGGQKLVVDKPDGLANLVSEAFSRRDGDVVSERSIGNIWFSECYNCNGVSVWIYDRLVYPATGSAPPPNPDLSSDIRRDYDEASTILDRSPRGAAALIRLAIQKLCKELGQLGKNINQDIGALVKGGLDPRVQKALDAVRVIGNEAVHPGQIDLRDDRATAETLFRLLNLVAEKMISEPKNVDEVYNSLPEEKRAAIEKRDEKK